MTPSRQNKCNLCPNPQPTLVAAKPLLRSRDGILRRWVCAASSLPRAVLILVSRSRYSYHSTLFFYDFLLLIPVHAPWQPVDR